MRSAAAQRLFAGIALVGTACSETPRAASVDATAPVDAIAAQSDSRAPPADGGVPLHDAGMQPMAEGGSPSEGGSTAEGGSAIDGGPSDALDEIPPTGASCPRTATWAKGRELFANTSFARFAGITLTEVTIAWTTTSGAIDVLDRKGSMMVNQLTPPPLQTNARAALDGSGNLIVAIAANGTDFVAFQRPNVAAAWATVAPAMFDAVHAAAVQANAIVSEPVLGGNGTSFFYLMTAASAVPTLYESTWDAPSGRWTAGVPLRNPELASADATHRRRATGVSSDDRTLFFFDEIAGKERAAWRDDPSASFNAFQDVTAAPEAVPNAACTQLYFQAADADAGGSGLFVAQ